MTNVSVTVDIRVAIPTNRTPSVSPLIPRVGRRSIRPPVLLCPATVEVHVSPPTGLVFAPCGSAHLDGDFESVEREPDVLVFPFQLTVIVVVPRVLVSDLGQIRLPRLYPPDPFEDLSMGEFVG